jgi:hypothetical protein
VVAGESRQGSEGIQGGDLAWVRAYRAAARCWGESNERQAQGRSPYPPQPYSVLPVLSRDGRPSGGSRLVAFESVEGSFSRRAAEHAAGADRVRNAAAQPQAVSQMSKLHVENQVHCLVCRHGWVPE